MARPLRPIESRSPTTEAAATLAREAALQARRRSGLRRRSIVVRVLRVAAPLAMAVLAAVLVGWVVGRSHKRDRTPGAASVDIHMSNPRFLGRDSRGRAFVLTGLTAVRDAQDAHLVHLTAPRLSLESAPGVSFVVTGRQGLYRDDSHKLTITGDVAVDDGRGNRFFSDEGEVDTDSGDVVGKSRAHGQGPAGTIEGDSYALSDHGDHATFTGRVKSVLYNHKGAAPAPPPGAKTP